MERATNDCETTVSGTDWDSDSEETLFWVNDNLPKDSRNASLQRLYRDNCGTEFGYLNFPINTSKRLKRNQNAFLVFCIILGKVEAKVDDEIYTLSQGDVFRVPRNSYYSLTNMGTNSTRIFFSRWEGVEGLDCHPVSLSQDLELFP
ncbi:hypothetical protein K469DRAFT_777872 [Zopfia rhizophila CBS 207.26]|uniref:Mif2/CENP-C cupin domain-containing protein n=1 Tax=Zopfia rhizophila CBS 207.26 TaxID=1314779 RepID=A0A6A6E268_9PEZI|nr:hypothetical protein K469DRAFT_692116 [Zopfia rhizophila CBS 207.26]KAF2185884.1 hypothetical protein K469DRAFT_777872 [Zopfia rhizophila CBS 207.26]